MKLGIADFREHLLVWGDLDEQEGDLVAKGPCARS